MTKKRVLIVDDSALVRRVLTDILEMDEDLEVVGTATDPYSAWDKMQSLSPDVMTLDVEMPRMDGLSFLEKLMIARPIPVVMVSSLTERGCQTTLRALELGAVDFVAKPKCDVRKGVSDIADEIITKVKTAAGARIRKPSRRSNVVASKPTAPSTYRPNNFKLIAIGSSTGGTEALYDVLTELPADVPPIVIVQHMPGGFTKSFAERLDRSCSIQVREAQNGDKVVPGQALLAPGGFHMEVVRSVTGLEVRITDTEPVNRFKPSVDVLFRSCAANVPRQTLGIILTGMGRDGADGMRSMYDTGAYTLAQDEASCVVYGMPKEAVAAGGVREVLPLDAIAQRVLGLTRVERDGSALANLRAATAAQSASLV